MPESSNDNRSPVNSASSWWKLFLLYGEGSTVYSNRAHIDGLEIWTSGSFKEQERATYVSMIIDIYMGERNAYV